MTALIDVADLASEISRLRSQGWRPVTIRPADDPAEAVLESSTGERVTLRRTPFSISRASEETAWHVGRAGMRYRDLIADRWDGRYIASHIAVPDGGLVTDDVHFHHVDFQFLAVRRGWVDVEYEGWGERLRMEVGDVVLQPPGIRHQVIETSPGFEIIEVGSPADHLTEFDPVLTLPDEPAPNRAWNEQPFVYSSERSCTREPWDFAGFTGADTGIGAATHGAVQVRHVRVAPDTPGSGAQRRSLRFVIVMDGSVTLNCAHSEPVRLEPGDSVTLPADSDERFLEPSDDCWMLDVTTPAPD